MSARAIRPLRILWIGVMLVAVLAIVAWWLLRFHGHYPPAPADVFPPATASDYVFGFERTACFGQCPTFDLRILASGDTVLRLPATRATPQGPTEFGHLRYVGKVDASTRQRLATLVAKGGFWSLRSAYRYPVTDNPGTTIQVDTPTRSWSVHVYAVPCRSSATRHRGRDRETGEAVPDVFCDLAEQLDDVACSTYVQGRKTSTTDALVPLWPPDCTTTP